MKEYGYYYKDKDGELRDAMTSEFLLTILIVFLALPFIAIGYWLWHFFTGNVIVIRETDYHKHNLKYYMKKDQEHE